jgi:hypothetical protein
MLVADALERRYAVGVSHSAKKGFSSTAAGASSAALGSADCAVGGAVWGAGGSAGSEQAHRAAASRATTNALGNMRMNWVIGFLFWVASR